MELNRRYFIQTLGLVSGSILFLPACSKPRLEWDFFTDDEAKLVIAIAEQIIPADTDPGATDAGVVYFIDKQLAGFYSNFGETYKNGLASLQTYCKEKYNSLFEELEYDMQTNVLKLMEQNKILGEYWKEHSSSGFFRLIRDHSMQGFYGSPRHGGNKNYVSYKMLKLDYPKILGQNRYYPRSSTLNVYKK